MTLIKIITITLISLFVTGCASNASRITFYSNPPGAIIYSRDSSGTSIINNGVAPVVLTYNLPENLDCGSTTEVKAKWDSGGTDIAQSFKVCKGQTYQHTFNSPVVGGYSPGTSSPSAGPIEQAKSQCKDLGFKPGTEKFGNCVLELNK